MLRKKPHHKSLVAKFWQFQPVSKIQLGNLCAFQIALCAQQCPLHGRMHLHLRKIPSHASPNAHTTYIKSVVKQTNMQNESTKCRRVNLLFVLDLLEATGNFSLPSTRQRHFLKISKALLLSPVYPSLLINKVLKNHQLLKILLTNTSKTITFL